MDSVLDGSPASSPPRPGELEISLFGSGYGESAVLHVGNGRWVVVDSCEPGRGSEPSPLTYLKEMGCDLAKSVLMVVATHWHDDHIRGLSQIIRACHQASFVCSEALRIEEFRTLCYAAPGADSSADSGVDEFRSTLEELRTGSSRRPQPMFAAQNRRLLLSRPDESGFPHDLELWSLSPSDRMMELSKHAICALLPEQGALPTTKLRLQDTPPNHTAIALWLSVGRCAVLLGADLEASSDTGRGWSCIVGSTARPQGTAQVYKVPHHGAQSADAPEVWTRMLSLDPTAILSPFSLAGTRLPTASDVTRILKRAGNAFITSRSLATKARKRPAAVERTIKEATRYMREVPHFRGHVRVRMDLLSDASPRVALFEGAIPLAQFEAS